MYTIARSLQPVLFSIDCVISNAYSSQVFAFCVILNSVLSMDTPRGHTCFPLNCTSSCAMSSNIIQI